MTYREENEQLREKLSEYEDILGKLLQGPLQEAVITSPEVDNMYRVRTRGGML